MFSYGDGCIMSAKKGRPLVNMGGFTAMRDHEVYSKAIEWGDTLRGIRDIRRALPDGTLRPWLRGLSEVLDDDYLEDRIGQVAYLADLLLERGVPVITPAGGTAYTLTPGQCCPISPSPSSLPRR